jgi:hypothetical protein
MSKKSNMNARIAVTGSRTRMKQNVTRTPSTFAVILGLVPRYQDIQRRFTTLRHGQTKLTLAAIAAKTFPARVSRPLLLLVPRWL